jgi:diacylglycerol O-acyltransferase / wax synthase
MPPAARLSQISAELRRRSERGEPDAAELVMRLAGLLPAPLHARFARAVYTRRFFSLIVTYLPGARRARWCAGARVRAVHPVLPLAEGVPVTAGAVLADGTVGIGILLDAALGLERDEVEEAVARAFEEATVAARGAVPERGGVR